MRKQSRGIKKLVLSAMFMAIGLILPFITGQIQQIGSMLLPMHIPVLFCGLVCGWQYGMMVGFILPLLRYLLFGMPPIFPIGVSMTFELAAYGAVIGLIMQQLSTESICITDWCNACGKTGLGIGQIYSHAGNHGTIYI